MKFLQIFFTKILFPTIIIISFFSGPFVCYAHSLYDCQFTNDDNDGEFASSNDDLQSSMNNGQKSSKNLPCDSFCPVLEFKGQCRCSILQNTASTTTTTRDIRLECRQTNASILMGDIENLIQQCTQFNLIELYVKDSNLTHLYNLPSGLYNIQELVLDNTGIDLETIRESNELLRSLKSLRISNENFTEIPETLFNGMEELQKLSLNRLGMAYINVDAFLSVEDSLILLELRSNRIRTIPAAVQSLSHLECLDLSGNDIQSVSDGNTVIFSTGLKPLKRLKINTMNCTCEFGKSRFATWLRTYAIKGVQCMRPLRLKEKDVSNTPIEEFCEPWPNGSGGSIEYQPIQRLYHFWLFLLILIILRLQVDFCSNWNLN